MKLRYAVLSLLCLVMGFSFTVFYSPMRFTGFLFVCAGVLAAVWGVLSRYREKQGVQLLRRILAGLLLVGVVVFTVLEVQIVSYGRTDEETEVSAVIILGAGVNGTVPSLSLLVRLEAALAYIEDQPEIPIVVTGSKGPGEEISEAECMAEWLIDHGVEPEQIYLEEEADNTQENIWYSTEILEKIGIDITGSIAVVSADYHLYRASLYWGPPGMVPVAAHMPGRYWPLTVNYYIREAFAAAKLLVFGS